MAITACDAYLAECRGIEILANLTRPKVPFTSEAIPGALCLWRTNGNGSHVDSVRVYPDPVRPVKEILRDAQASTLRVRGGDLVIRSVEAALSDNDQTLLDHLAASPRSTGFLMARSLSGVGSEECPRLRGASDVSVVQPVTETDYLAVRRMVSSIFGGASSAYDPEKDFYSAPGVMTYLALFERHEVISAGSLIMADGIANIWSICTREHARHRGAASVVAHACLVEAARQGAQTAVLGTGEELARPNGLYARLGFAVVGHEHSWRVLEIDRISLGE